MNATLQDGLVSLGRALIDQDHARVIVRPNADKDGYWFGGGNLVQDSEGCLYITGRYRNAGDSTTGLGKGDRGLELAIFASRDDGQTFQKTVSFSKEDLSASPGEVVSIEGTALNWTENGVELIISTEKLSHSYPDELAAFQKPGTGVWSIDRLSAPTVGELAQSEVTPLISSDNPEYLHVKDPVIHTTADGATVLFFCTHPFGWSSSNSAFCIRPRGGKEFDAPKFDFFRRGFTWDVAATRISDVLPLSWEMLGVEESIQLVFYDGAECLRPHTENAAAVSRPRGYSCEEIGGLAFTTNDQYDHLERLSVLRPLFISPHGTGSSRYVHTLATREGVYATWQQAQPDGSQPLVMNFVDSDTVRRILSA